MEAYEALLANLDDSKPKHESILTKVDANFLQIFELADTNKLTLDDSECGKKSERRAALGPSSASSTGAGELISCLQTLNLTQLS
ncbi:hypothetical protein EVAR_40855_1 [Eumeta japonica]|uniref:Uncharacterized protein n=1 Tax=Eumeta variegata TaxID=151549 RepID=A0A4C1X6Q4_EUMVA|nr:hypothetical protein EVAR_40855_1 [Eumeta japonica]